MTSGIGLGHRSRPRRTATPASTKKSLQNLADLAGELREGLQKLLSKPLAIVSLRNATSAKETFESAINNRTAQTL